ncbi:hypothetical protein Tco_0768596 [Tanacetum coccineum]
MQGITLPTTQASLKRSLFHFSQRSTHFYRLSHSKIVDIKKVKFHDIPVTVFSEDGLSAIATKLAMIELQADADLKDTIIVVVLKLIGTSGGNSKLAEKGVNSIMVSSAHGTSSKAFGSPTTTPLAERINDVERKMLNERLVLLDDDGKLLKKVGDPVNADSDHKVDEVFIETTIFRSLTSFNVDNNFKSGSGVANKSLYKQMR